MRVDARQIAEALGRGKEKKTGRSSWLTLCCAHDNTDTPALSVTDGTDGKVLVRCHAGCRNEDVIGALRSMGLWSSSSHRTWVAQRRAPRGAAPYAGKPHPKLGAPTRWWEYVDREGRVRGYVARFEERDSAGKVRKTTLPVTWCRCEEDAVESWFYKGLPEPRCLFGEDELVKDPGRHVLVVEGEKAAEAAREIVGKTYHVTTWQGGSSAVRKTDWSVLRGRDVTLWPDADGPGDKAMRELAEILIAEEAKVVRRVEISAAELVSMGLDPDEAEGWDLADSAPASLDIGAKLYGATPYLPVGDEVIDRFNRKFAMTMVGGQAVVIQEELRDGRPLTTYLSTAAFREFYGNRNVVSGKQTIPEPVYWLKHEQRRSYSGLTFRPNGDVPGMYNLWRGFTVDPDPTGSWDMLQAHVLENVARGDESLARWVTGWMAHMVQHPDRKLGTSLSVRGKMGTGKTVLGQHLGELFRPHYVLVDSPRYVTGNFNSHMASCLLLHADEAFFAGSPQHHGLLRGLVTGDTVRIEQKGKDSFELKSYMRLYVSTNESWVVPAGFEERRFAVLDCGDGRKQDRPFFKEMERQMLDGGYSAMLHDLLRFDLTSVDVSRIPVTQALQEQKTYALDTVSRFWLERLHAGEVTHGEGRWPDHVVMHDLHQDYVLACQQWGEHRRMDLTTFTRELKRDWPCDPQTVRVKATRRDPSKAARPWALVTDRLERHRRHFEDRIGAKIDWMAPDVEHAVASAGRQERLDDGVPF